MYRQYSPIGWLRQYVSKFYHFQNELDLLVTEQEQLAETEAQLKVI